MNLFDQPGGFYGYPYCWSMYNLTTVTTPRLTQYAQPDFMNDGTHNDAWCQNTENVIPPKYAMRAHNAPLDILFYAGGTNFPSTVGNAFVSLHGSWDRTPAAGYSVIQVTFQNGLPVSEINMIAYKGPGEYASGWIRPVGLQWYTGGGRNTTLLVTDDSTGLIVALSYNPACTCGQFTPTSSTSATSSPSTTSTSSTSTHSSTTTHATTTPSTTSTTSSPSSGSAANVVSFFSLSLMLSFMLL